MRTDDRMRSTGGNKATRVAVSGRLAGLARGIDAGLDSHPDTRSSSKRLLLIGLLRRSACSALLCMGLAMTASVAVAAPAPVELEDNTLSQTADAEFNRFSVAMSELAEIALGEPLTVEEPERPAEAAIPVPAAIWLFSSALFGFVVLANRKRV